MSSQGISLPIVLPGRRRSRTIGSSKQTCSLFFPFRCEVTHRNTISFIMAYVECTVNIKLSEPGNCGIIRVNTVHHRVNDAKAKKGARNAVTENKNIFWSDDAAKIVPGLSPLLFRLLSLISGLLSLVSCLSYPVSCLPSPFIYHPSPL